MGGVFFKTIGSLLQMSAPQIDQTIRPVCRIGFKHGADLRQTYGQNFESFIGQGLPG